jgi:hypothetical protein
MEFRSVVSSERGASPTLFGRPDEIPIQQLGNILLRSAARVAGEQDQFSGGLSCVIINDVSPRDVAFRAVTASQARHAPQASPASGPRNGDGLGPFLAAQNRHLRCSAIFRRNLDSLLTVLACRAGWLWNYYLWRRVRIVVWVGWGIVVAIIAGEDDEAIAEVMISIVISVVISTVEATTVAEVRVSVSSRAIADYAAAGRSDADMSGSESTATTNVAPSESTATSKAATTAVSGGERVRRHRGTERNGGKEDHRLTRDRLLLEVLKEVHNISLSSSRLKVHVPELFTKAQIKIVFPLHSLLNGIQEWKAALRTSCSFLRDLSQLPAL